MKTALASRLDGFGTTIFAEMSALAVRTNAINLGQGFPDADGPREVLDVAVDAIRAGLNQYPPGLGDPVLRDAIVDHQQRFYGISLDPLTEVLVTTGATEALAATILALLNPGDEVVLFEPMYDSYQACIALAGAVARPVALRPSPEGSYGYDSAELAGSFSDRTKFVLLNTPHNPTGKVFTTQELAEIAALAIEFDTFVVTDEVYEHLVFTPAEHRPIATLPEMFDRTLTISSGGKTFSTTGWKIGWLSGPAELVSAAKTAKQFLTYVSGAPFQPAIAAGLALGDDFYTDLASDLQARRDQLAAGLSAAGFGVIVPEATYFLTADISGLAPGVDGIDFCLALPELIGVVAVPTQVFYVRPELGRHLVRFACCKQPDVLDAAIDRLVELPTRLAERPIPTRRQRPA